MINLCSSFSRRKQVWRYTLFLKLLLHTLAYMTFLEPITNNFSTVDTIEDTKPPHSRLPLPDSLPPHICDFPQELIVTILQLVDINTVGMLAFTCHTLFHNIFIRSPLPSNLLSAIVTRTLQLRDVSATKRLCEQIKYQVKVPIDLTLYHSGPDLNQALEILQQSFEVHSLSLKIPKLQMGTAHAICTKCPGVKKLIFQLSKFAFANEPGLATVEEIHITSPGTVNLPQLFHLFPSLKRLVINANMNADIEKLPPFSNSLEYCIPSNYLAYSQGSYFSDIEEIATSIPCQTAGMTTGIAAYYFGSYYHHSKNYAKAEEFLQKSIALSPRFVPAKELLAHLLMDAQPGRAEQLLKECLDIFPQHSQAAHTLGRLLLKADRKQEAIPYLMKAALIEESDGTDFVAVIRDLYSVAPATADKIIKQYVRNGQRNFLICQHLQDISYNPTIASAMFAHLSEIPTFKYSSDFDLFWQLICVQNSGTAWNDAAFDYVTQQILPEYIEAMRQLLKSNLFADIQPWFSIFDILKKSGGDIIPLLDEFYAADFFLHMVNANSLVLLDFLSKSDWKVERQHVLRLIQSTRTYSWILVDYAKKFTDNESILQELCELASDSGDISLQAKLIPYLPASFIRTKIEFLYNSFRSNPNNKEIHIQLAGAYVERKNLKLAELFVKRAQEHEADVEQIRQKLDALRLSTG